MKNINMEYLLKDMLEYVEDELQDWRNTPICDTGCIERNIIKN